MSTHAHTPIVTHTHTHHVASTLLVCLTKLCNSDTANESKNMNEFTRIPTRFCNTSARSSNYRTLQTHTFRRHVVSNILCVFIKVLQFNYSTTLNYVPTTCVDPEQKLLNKGHRPNHKVQHWITEAFADADLYMTAF